ncbi:hypothetical protein HYH02_000583 [Chlamydomonas schloesseri]|uniref:Uncharacterized protein n=1 Tax=Chlamydomonas schloesseri TaxID=2026947 RepID=A0A836BD05_9CHLO|nr:hypothetical protein HYH02_000583 [Chlamydomonas schloesseri]|eukprot:KAG2454748.1 hypothetical protein HYH02_000583 [Chlamydomonas schloesseri]
MNFIHVSCPYPRSTTTSKLPGFSAVAALTGAAKRHGAWQLTTAAAAAGAAEHRSVPTPASAPAATPAAADRAIAPSQHPSHTGPGASANICSMLGPCSNSADESWHR